jgi:hypothetical protein
MLVSNLRDFLSEENFFLPLAETCANPKDGETGPSGFMCREFGRGNYKCLDEAMVLLLELFLLPPTADHFGEVP